MPRIAAVRVDRAQVEALHIQPQIATDARFASNNVRTRNRVELEVIVQGVFARLTYAKAVDRLTEAQTAYGAINSVHDLIGHPQLRTRPMEVHGRVVQVPATPYLTEWDDASYAAMPQLDQYGAASREEFAKAPAA